MTRPELEQLVLANLEITPEEDDRDDDLLDLLRDRDIPTAVKKSAAGHF